MNEITSNKKFYIISGKIDDGTTIYFKKYDKPNNRLCATKKYLKAKKFDKLTTATRITKEKFFNIFKDFIVPESLRILEIEENVVVSNSFKIN